MDVHRAFVYRFLSEAFAYPHGEHVQGLIGALGDLRRSLKALDIPFPVDELEEALTSADALELQGEHNALFATELAAPAFETAYELDKTARKAAELADIRGFYQAFGLEVALPVEPDSLVAELAFLALLLHKGLHVGEEGQRVCREAFGAFLRDHLGRWYKAFAGRLREGAKLPLYPLLAGLLEAFLDRETASLKFEPLKAHARETLEGVTFPCGGA